MSVFLFRILKFFLSLLIVSSFLFALLPTILNTEWGRKQIIAWVNDSIPGKIEIQNLDLSWGHGQVLEGVLLKDPEGQSVLEFEKFSTEATLWQLLSKSVHLGHTQIQELNGVIATDDKGRTNLERALGIFYSDVSLKPSTIVLSNVNADVDLFSDNQPFSIHIQGLTRQDDLNGSFKVQVILTGLETVDWDHFSENTQRYFTLEGSQEAKIQAQIINFPIALIDHLSTLNNPQFSGFFRSLLGDRLNLTIDKEPNKKEEEGLAFHLSASTPLMEGNFKGKILNGILTLQAPAVFQFDLKPESMNPLISRYFQLLAPSFVKMVCSTLSIPLNFNDLHTLECQANLILPKTAIALSSLGKLDIFDFQMKVNAPLSADEIRLEFLSRGQQENQESFDILWNAELVKPSHFSDFSDLLSGMSSSLRISHFPLQAIPFLQAHPELQKGVGLYADIDFSLVPNGKEKWKGILSLQTPLLGVKEASFLVGKEVVLDSPATLNWVASPDFLQNLFKNDLWSFDEAASLQMTLKDFRISLNNLESISYQLESSIPSLGFSKLLQVGRLHFQNLLLNVKGQSLHQFNSQLKGQFVLSAFDPSYSNALEEVMQFTQTSSWEIGADKNIEMPQGSLQITHPMAHIQLKGRLIPNHQIEMTEPAEMNVTLTPKILEMISRLAETQWPLLKKDVHLHLAIEPTVLDFTSFSFSRLKMQGNLELDRLILQDAYETESTLENINLFWVFDAPMNNFYANIKGSVYNQRDAKPTPLSAYFQFWPDLNQYNVSQTQAEFRLNCAGLPVSLANILFGTEDLAPILGPILDVNIKTFFDPTQQKAGYWDVLVDSSYFHLKGRFKLDQAITIFDTNKPPSIRLLVTPESYSYLKTLFSFENERQLDKSFSIGCTLTQLFLPLKHSWADAFKMDLQFSSTDIQWQGEDLSHTPINLEGNFTTQQLSDHLNFSIQAHYSSSPITFQGVIKNLIDSEGHFSSWQEATFTAAIDGSHVSPFFIQNLFFLNQEQTQKLHALFGESLSIHSRCEIHQLNGLIEASLKGTQGQMLLDGKIQQGILTLNRPLEGSFKITPLLSQVFLSAHFPFLNSAIEAESPIQFNIAPDNFSCPLFPFQREHVKIGKGTLNLGKIRFRNQGDLQTVLNLIHSIPDPYLTIWFTPLYFELDQGIFNFQRLDLLVAHIYPLASWGTLDLNTEEARFVLGVTEQTLQRAFGIQGIDKEYILPIFIQSRHGKIEMDKKALTRKIATLIAQSQGKTAKFFGDLLDLALSHPEETAPPPTTTPLPWQEEVANQTPELSQALPKQEEHKKKRPSSSKPLEQNALQLLDHILNS